MGTSSGEENAIRGGLVSRESDCLKEDPMAATVPMPAATAPDPAPLLLRYRRAMDAIDELPIVFLVRRRCGRFHWA